MILFIATYSGYLLRASNGYWILISAAAVLAGEHMENIKKNNRSCARRNSWALIRFLTHGTGFTIRSKSCYFDCIECIDGIFHACQLYDRQLFTNPQVLLLMTIGSSFVPLHLIPWRFSGTLIGSLLAMGLIFLMDFALKQIQQSMIYRKE